MPRLLPVAMFLGVAALYAGSAPVTFYKDALPVIQKRCLECHRSGEAAPMAFTTYAEVRPWAKAIRQAVLSKKMPPWFADPHYGKFSNDRSLSQPEIDAIVKWVDEGSLEGNRAEAPSMPTFADGWTIGKPDMVLDIGADYKVPASGTIEYTYFVVPTGFTEDKWVEKIEVRPTARSVVHHIVLMARPPGSKYHKDAKIGEPFVPKHSPEPPTREPDTGVGGWFGLAGGYNEMVSVYVPGGVAYETRPGQARLIPAGSDLVFQMHYTANGKETTDRSRVGIVFAKQPPKERVVNAFIINNRLHIPPGADNHQVNARVKVNAPALLQSFFPHMHLRGKAFQYVAKYPTGETETLLKVPAYDFNWQLTYQLEKPLPLPAGTELTATAWYDNSPNNRYNPDPKADVYWGDQSWEEMLAGFVDLVIPVDANPRDIARPKQTKPATGTGGGN